MLCVLSERKRRVQLRGSDIKYSICVRVLVRSVVANTLVPVLFLPCQVMRARESHHSATIICSLVTQRYGTEQPLVPKHTGPSGSEA